MAIRKNEPELAPADVRRIRERLGLTPAEAGDLIGGGPKAFAKYESGVIHPAAAVANLLRLLERSPEQLQSLTGKVPSVDVTGLGPLEVAPDHIASLTPQLLARLTQRLLTAEAQTHGLPMSGAHVAAELTVGDGGEDALFRWDGGPDRTQFLPSRRNQFQLKATNIGAAAAGRDVLDRRGAIKPMIQNELQAGANYIMMVTHPAVRQSMARHEAAIVSSLTSAGFTPAPGQVVVMDGSQIAQWVNSHPGVAAWLLGHIHPGLSVFHDLTHWGGRHEHERSPWVPEDERLDPFAASVRAIVTTPRGVARVVGSSGVGKSRLTLKALEAAGELSNLVVYAVEGETGAHALVSAVQSIVDGGRRAIVVIDRCSPDLHADLAAIVRRSNSKASLITLDHEFDPTGGLPPDTLIVGKASRTVCEAIAENIRPTIEQSERARIAHLADGNPQAAILLAEVWDQGRPVSDAVLSARIIEARAGSEGVLQLRAAKLMAVFGAVGVRGDADEVGKLATIPGAPSEHELRAGLDGLLRRGLTQMRGRMMELQPALLATSLAALQWREWSEPTRAFVITELDHRLRVRAARGLSMLNREPIAQQVVAALAGWTGPFVGLEGLQAKGATEVISALAEVDAIRVGERIDRALQGLSVDQLRSIDGDTRRHLVWALSKIGFKADGFEVAARLLLRLAVAENETWNNNATGYFKGLFGVLGGATEAGGKRRFLVLDEILYKGSEAEVALAVEALIDALDTRGVFRMVGPEEHGSRPALKSWRPETWGEVWDYLRECIDRLVVQARKSGEVADRARTGLGQELRLLISNQLIEDVERAVNAVVDARGQHWPEALQGLGHVLEYDAESLRGGEEDRIRAMIGVLTPRDLKNRVRLLVTEMPWDYPIGERLDFSEREAQQKAVVEGLANEVLAGSPAELVRLLPDLSKGEQRKTPDFGAELARVAKEPLVMLEEIVSAYVSAPSGNRNFGLLGGFVGELAKRYPLEVRKLKSRAAASADLGPTLPYLCGCIHLEPDDVELVIGGVKADTVPLRSLSAWTFGGEMERLGAEAVANLLDFIIDRDLALALDLLTAYTFRNEDRLDELRPQLRHLALRSGERVEGARSPGAEYRFKEAMTWILEKGRDDPDASAIAAD
ncbi:MAG: type II toxin-antitoxin system MqsA family antitoxin, partial [Devosia sp.]